VLLCAGVGIGHLTTERTSKRGAPPGQPASGVNDSGQPEALAPSEPSEDSWLGVSDAEFRAAEREGQKSFRERSEWRVRRYESELDLLRALSQDTAIPDKIVARLQERFKKSREEADRGQDPYVAVYAAARLLGHDRAAAFGAVAEWVRKAQGPREHRAAVKLLALLKVPEAHDLLAAEISGPASAAALSGLVALHDPRSHDVFKSVMEDDSLLLDPMRITAAGGLHRLGDPAGLRFLHDRFFDKGSGPFLRKRILFNVGANPARESVSELRDMLSAVRPEEVHLEAAKDREALREWLTLSGVSDGDLASLPLLDNGKSF
jgi:hypothetical protein